MKREILENALAFHLHHFALVVHEVADGEIFLERIVDAIEAALLEARKVKGGFAQRLARDGASVDRASSHIFAAFNNGDALAKIGSLRTRFFSGRAAANYDQIEMFACSHHNLQEARMSLYPQQRHKSEHGKRGQQPQALDSSLLVR